MEVRNMFTVVIAEKEHIDKIEEYELFLKPFLATGDVVFCPWNTKAKRLADMVPTLANQVGRRKEWRALIVCDEEGLEQQNPFDLVKNLPGKFEGPTRGMTKDAVEHLENEAQKNKSDADELDKLKTVEQDMQYIYSEEYNAFLQQEHKKKLKAYEEAAQKPLTRLVTFFCDMPTVTKMDDSKAAQGDPDYTRYIVEHLRKSELRREILDDEKTETSQPTEIVCLAKRTYVSAEKEFDTVWSSHTEQEYSHFYDRNMYFDKMRYLVFDILPKSQRDYMFDYIRFLYAMILLASNDIPKGCLANERVYRLECENDERALCQLLQTYEAKLNVTKETLNQNIQKILEKKPRVLTDKEATRIFSAQINQPVVFGEDFDEKALYARARKVGLSNGCPKDENVLWEEEYRRSQKGLQQMLKQSRRALRRAAAEARVEQDFRLDRAELLTDYQLEDIQERTDKNELDMLRTETTDLYEEGAYMDQFEEADQKVKRKIEDRMFTGTTIGLGLAACFAFLLGFFTIFVTNSKSNAFNFITSLIILGVAAGAFVVTAVVVLFFLRRGLTTRFRKYNNTMHDISGQVYGAMGKYSKYLTHMSNVRRGYGVLNSIQDRHDPDMDRVTLFQKHIADIEVAKDSVKEVFGQYMVGTAMVDLDELFPYDFNFSIPTEYKYPLPYSEGTARKITFIQAGVYAIVPVEFVKRIMVRREELYE